MEWWQASLRRGTYQDGGVKTPIFDWVKGAFNSDLEVCGLSTRDYDLFDRAFDNPEQFALRMN
jgi:hypothetical protein